MPRSTVWIALADPALPKDRATLQVWYEGLLRGIDDPLRQVQSLRTDPPGAYLAPNPIKFGQLTTPADWEKLQRIQHAYEVLAPWILQDGKGMIHVELFLGDLRGEVPKSIPIEYRQNSAADAKDALALLLFVSQYAIAMDAERVGDSRGTCLVLREAQHTRQGIKASKWSLVDFDAAVAKRLAKCPA